MEKPVILKHPSLLVLIWLVLFSVQATAAIDNVGVLDSVLERYSAAAATWSTIIVTHATWLFWTLAVISMVWTFGMMALRKADIGEFYVEFIRFIVFTGFFWWLLTNGSSFAESIMRSLRMAGAEAAGVPNTMAPSGIVDIGFDIFVKALNQTDLWKPIDSLIGMIMALIILVVFALIGVNMLLLLVSGWILAYAGVFFLGFGGSRWTSDLAITYFKTVLGIAGQLLAMILLIGIGKSFVDQYYAGMSNGLLIKELAVMLLVSVILLALVRTVPSVVGSLAGGNTGALGQGFGAGAVIGATAMAGAAISTAGTAITAGAAGAAGGVQALMAAYSKASAAEGASGDASSLLAAAGGGGGTNAANDSALASPLAAAMGDGGRSSSDDADGLTGSERSGSSGGPPEETNQKQAAAAGGDKGGAVADSRNEAEEAKKVGLGTKAARAGKIAAGTAANLAVGAWDVAKTKGADLRESAMDRIGESTGSKIASAISARAAAEKVAKFGNDSLSAAADDKGVDAESEVAAFRDRGTKAS